MGTKIRTKWFILIARETSPDMIVGPYADQEKAIFALDHSVFIDGLVEEDGLECMAIELEFFQDKFITYTVPPEETEENGYPDAEVVVGAFHHGVQEKIDD
jgi:hypothetical protein